MNEVLGLEEKTMWGEQGRASHVPVFNLCHNLKPCFSARGDFVLPGNI